MPPSLSRKKPEESKPQLINFMHHPGCSDPNCFLPACINEKLRKSHVQNCTKRLECCDICKQLERATGHPRTMVVNAMACPLASPGIQESDKLAGSPAATELGSQNEDELSIIRIVNLPTTPQENTQRPHMTFQDMDGGETLAGNLNHSKDGGTSNAVVARHKTLVVPYHAQLKQEQNDPTYLERTSCFETERQQCFDTMPKLEVLCKALKALGSVIELVKSSELEVHAIPLLEQALAEMKVTAQTRLDGRVRARATLLPMANTAAVMEHCETDVGRAGSQWIPFPPSIEPPLPQPPSSAELIIPGCLSFMRSSPTRPSDKADDMIDLYEDTTGDVDTDLLYSVEELLG